jgi:hypothetical protein
MRAFSLWLDRKLGLPQGWGLPMVALTAAVLVQLVGSLLLLAVHLGWRPWFVLLMR